MKTGMEKRRAMAARRGQKLFGHGRMMHGNVVMNFMRRLEAEFGIYGAAFWRAGRSLAESLARQRGYRDYDACPIVFLYGHALELYMKAIVRRGRSLVALAGKRLPINPQTLNRHELLPLTEAINYIFKHVGWTWSTEVEGVRTFSDFKVITQEIDRLGTASGIPSKRKVSLQFLITSDSMFWSSHGN